MNRIRNFAGAVVLFAAASTSHAVVYDFEDITGFVNRQNLPALGIQNSYLGFQWPSDSSARPWAVVNNSDSQFNSVGALSGSQALWNWSDGPYRDLVFGSAHTVNGAYFNVFTQGASWGADQVFLQAFDASNNLIATSATISLSETNPTWTWVGLNATGVTRLRVNNVDLNGGTGGGWWTMDNLTLDEPIGNAPEPGTLALLGLGLAGFGFARRRNRKAA